MYALPTMCQLTNLCELKQYTISAALEAITNPTLQSIWHMFLDHLNIKCINIGKYIAIIKL